MIVIASVVLVALALGGAAAARTGVFGGADELTLRGTYTLFDAEDMFDPSVEGGIEDCEGTGGYSDFSAGQAVTVRDGSGEIIGASTMRNAESRDELVAFLIEIGQADDEEEAGDLADLVDELDAVCTLITEFEVNRSDFYEVKIGNRRGELSYSHDQLAERDFAFELTLGS